MKHNSINKITETHWKIIRVLSKSHWTSHKELCFLTQLPKCRVTRYLFDLKKINWVLEKVSGKFKDYNINHNKKEEIISALGMFESCNNILKNHNYALLRFHNIKIISNIITIDNYLFNKGKYHKYHPKNRICRKRYIEGVGNVNLNLNSNTVNVEVTPYYVIFDLCGRNPATLLHIEQLYDLALFDKFNKLYYSLQADGVYLEPKFKVIDLSTAIMNDPLASTAVKLGYKNSLIDQSVPPVPEYEEHGLNSIKRILCVLRLRKFCADNNTTELQLAELLEKNVIK